MYDPAVVERSCVRVWRNTAPSAVFVRRRRRSICELEVWIGSDVGIECFRWVNLMQPRTRSDHCLQYCRSKSADRSQSLHLHPSRERVDPQAVEDQGNSCMRQIRDGSRTWHVRGPGISGRSGSGDGLQRWRKINLECLVYVDSNSAFAKHLGNYVGILSFLDASVNVARPSQNIKTAVFHSSHPPIKPGAGP